MRFLSFTLALHRLSSRDAPEKTGKVALSESAGEPEGCLEGMGDEEARCRLVSRGVQRRVRRVLWFHASHERDVVSLLEPLVSARGGDVDALQAENSSTSAPGSQENLSLSDDGRHLPFFDEAWFMGIKQVRPSRFAPPTAREILRGHGLDVQGVSEGPGRTQSANSLRVTVEPDEASGRSQGAESTAGWQRTLEQVIDHPGPSMRAALTSCQPSPWVKYDPR